jgi:hypothetical protein
MIAKCMQRLLAMSVSEAQISNCPKHAMFVGCVAGAIEISEAHCFATLSCTTVPIRSAIQAAFAKPSLSSAARPWSNSTKPDTLLDPLQQPRLCRLWHCALAPQSNSTHKHLCLQASRGTRQHPYPPPAGLYKPCGN